MKREYCKLQFLIDASRGTKPLLTRSLALFMCSSAEGKGLSTIEINDFTNQRASDKKRQAEQGFECENLSEVKTKRF